MRAARRSVVVTAAGLVVATALAAPIVIERARSAGSTPRATGTTPQTSDARATSPPTVVTSPPTGVSTTVTTSSTVHPWSVRKATFAFYDASRMSPARGTSPAHSGRLLRTTLRWPVSADGRVAPGRLPLFVFAHGFALSAATYATMLDDLARAGIVVAAPDFPGESAALPGRAVEWDLANEPCDVEFVAASLEQNPPVALHRALSNAPLIVGGHSDGGTAAAGAGYASTCSLVPVRGVVALSPDDVPMTAAFRFGRPPPLLAMTGSEDEVNPVGHTHALYQHVPGPAWLVTIEGGSHLGTFTVDPDLGRIDAMIADFVFMAANGNTAARARLTRTAGGRIQVLAR